MTIGILFVCTGNICRSPTAEGVFRTLVERSNLGDEFTIDSAGTYHGLVGSAPSPPAVEAAARRGYDISGLCARLLVPEDVERFDYPIALDRGHLAALRRMAPLALLDRPRMLLEFAPEVGLRDVADPYMRAPEDYERALDLIEAGCVGLLAHIRRSDIGVIPSAARDPSLRSG